jgi:hypothetical protein
VEAKIPLNPELLKSMSIDRCVEIFSGATLVAVSASRLVFWMKYA